jgi:cysteine-rich repeat protein
MTGSGPSGADHDFGTALSAADIEDLVNFMMAGLIDMTLVIDLATGASNGDVSNGEFFFEGPAGCGDAACHGIRGTRILFEDGEESLGGLSNGNPWEVLHKIRWGNPGSAMPSALRDNGLTDDDANDVLAYAQTLPETWACGDGFIDGDEGCDDGNTIDGDGCAADCSTETLDGEALFETHCSSCHGPDGSGAIGPDIRGTTAAAIQSAIDEDNGGMGTLDFLAPAELQAISDVL